MLIHARTDTNWFHDWVYGKAELRFLRGRLHFNGSKWNAPFPSMLAIYRPGQNTGGSVQISIYEGMDVN